MEELFPIRLVILTDSHLLHRCFVMGQSIHKILYELFELHYLLDLIFFLEASLAFGEH